MFRHVPNALTASRLLLAAVFFAMLAYYQNQGPLEGRTDVVWLNLKFPGRWSNGMTAESHSANRGSIPRRSNKRDGIYVSSIR